MGEPGNGKTTIAESVCLLFDQIVEKATEYLRKNSWILKRDGKVEVERHYRRLQELPKWRMLAATEIVNIAQHNPEKYELLKHPCPLIIDDFGREPTIAKIYGTEITPIIDLIELRYNGMYPTIITTNYDADKIKEKYGERIYDRFKEVCEVIWYSGASFR